MPFRWTASDEGLKIFIGGRVPHGMADEGSCAGAEGADNVRVGSPGAPAVETRTAVERWGFVLFPSACAIFVPSSPPSFGSSMFPLPPSKVVCTLFYRIFYRIPRHLLFPSHS